MMLHHLSLPTNDLQRAADFYDAVLGALGYSRVWTQTEAMGYGVKQGEDILALKLQTTPIVVPGPGFHLAFAAADEASVRAFHLAAVQHGGRDNGAPGLRPHYGERYFAAFVHDPDGYRIEAVYTPCEDIEH